MKKILASILAFVAVTIGAVALFSYQAPEPATRYYCPPDKSAFVEDNIHFPACEGDVIAYDVQEWEEGAPFGYTISFVHAEV